MTPASTDVQEAAESDSEYIYVAVLQRPRRQSWDAGGHGKSGIKITDSCGVSVW